MVADWWKTGNESVQKTMAATVKQAPSRKFWLKPGSKKTFIFLDDGDSPFHFWLHTAHLGDDWIESVCVREFAECAWCQAGYHAAQYAVMAGVETDIEAKDGRKGAGKKLLYLRFARWNPLKRQVYGGDKGNQLKGFQDRRETRMQAEGKGLALCKYAVSRSDSKQSARIGDAWELIHRMGPEAMAELKDLDGNQIKPAPHGMTPDERNKLYAGFFSVHTPEQIKGWLSIPGCEDAEVWKGGDKPKPAAGAQRPEAGGTVPW